MKHFQAMIFPFRLLKIFSTLVKRMLRFSVLKKKRGKTNILLVTACEEARDYRIFFLTTLLRLVLRKWISLHLDVVYM